MTPEQRDKAVVALAPHVFAFSQEPLTEKGAAALSKEGLAFFYGDELKKLRLMVLAVASELERPQQAEQQP